MCFLESPYLLVSITQSLSADLKIGKSAEIKASGSPTSFTASQPITMADTSQYKVGIVLSIENKSGGGKKPLKACSVNIGGGEPITVATSASNVREGSRYVHV